METVEFKSSTEIEELFNADPIAKDYLDLITDHELALWVPDSMSERFPPILFDWKHPSAVTNAVLEVGNIADLTDSVRVLTLAGCHHVQLRFRMAVSMAFLEECLHVFDNGLVDDIQLVVNYVPGVEERKWLALLDGCERLNSVRICLSPYLTEVMMGDSLRPLIFIPHAMDDYGPAIERMVITMGLFCESQDHNTYLNRKLYITKGGAVQNAPETLKILGNTKNVQSSHDIEAIASSAACEALWTVHKDYFDDCSNCEFRHMCVDNRIPVQREDGTWYHTRECAYNPFICKWKDEEGYRTLAECGVRIDATGFTIDHERIAALNAELWGE